MLVGVERSLACLLTCEHVTSACCPACAVHRHMTRTGDMYLQQQKFAALCIACAICCNWSLQIRQRCLLSAQADAACSCGASIIV